MTRTIITVLFTSCVSLSTAAAQSQYTRSLCIKVEPGKMAEYTKLQSDVRPAALARANAGEFSGRLILRSAYPAGMEATCDFMSVTLYPGFPPDPKSTMPQDAVFEKAHVSMKPAEYTAALTSTGKLRKAELWRIQDSFGTPELGNYLRLDYMKVKPDDFSNWIKAEKETWKPLHQARAELGSLKGWALTTLSMPSGSALHYNAMTVNMFKDWAQIGMPTKYQDAAKKAFPGKDMTQILAQPSLRDLVRTELYEVVDVIRPGASATSTAKK